MLLLLLGCAPETEETTPEEDSETPEDTSNPVDTSVTPTDADGDGVISVETGGEDCDDTNPAVNPSAIEECNGYDDNCDGLTDDSGTTLVTYYADTDADTYGDAYEKARSCAAPAGYVADGTDCDDADPEVHPGAQEVCDDGDVDEDCDDLVNSGDDSAIGTATLYPDLDNDGYGDPDRPTERCGAGGAYIEDDSDCDDTDDEVFPGAVEECNGVDDDCNGTLDDGGDTSTFYADADGDGYGDADATAEACTAPPGYVGNSADCDDAAKDAHPGGTEVCDALDTDEDCDGNTDDGDASTLGKSTWYIDNDRDGYGTTASTTAACDLPSGYSANATDCDDANATKNPGALEECDGGDDDCDGLVDDDDPSLSGGATWYIDADGDGFGDSSSTVATCDPPSGYVDNTDDCDDTSDRVSPDDTEVCSNGIDDDCDGADSVCGLLSGTITLETDADATLSGESTSDHAGWSVAWAGDANRDGKDDLAIGAPDNDEGGTGAGKVYLLYGDVSGAESLGSATVELVGGVDDGMAGWSVDGAGDTDGDGRDDLIIGTPGDAGVAQLVTSIYSTTLGRTSTDYAGESSGDEAGSSVAGLGDVDDNGADDFIVGAPYNDDGGRSAGKAYLLHGGTAAGALSTAEAEFTGENASDLAGASVAAAGDIDGDGKDDLVIGAPWNDSGGSYAGRYYVFTGNPSGSFSLSAADAILTGDAAGDVAGWSAAGHGDLDDDGNDDLILGADSSDIGGTNAGAAFVFFGPVSGSKSLGAADVTCAGENAGDHAGFSVAMAGDVDQDGKDDALIGAFDGDRGATDGGVSYLLYGALSGSIDLGGADAFLVSNAAGAQAGYVVAGPGDADDNGHEDLFVGAPYLGSGDAGGAFLVYSGL